MLFRVSEIHKYEPARAEKDIAEFVKQYERCDICDQNENPKLKCSECNWFICDLCSPSHSKLKPTHITEPILTSKKHTRTQAKKSCIQHPEQTLNLFCIICQKCLCHHCERYSHTQCKLKVNDRTVQLSFMLGFLRDYVESKVERQLQLQSGTLLRTVYLTEFVKESKSWFETLLSEVRCIVDEINQYQQHLVKLNDEIKDCPTTHLSSFQDVVNNILADSEDLRKNITVLLENENEYEVA